MRVCTDVEYHYHSFVGEVAAFCWSVSKCKVYLWETWFYALCDMKTLYKILKYDRPIHSLRRCSQELMAYKFLTFHRPYLMMKDVDALNRGLYQRVWSTILQQPPPYKNGTFSGILSLTNRMH